MTTGGNGNVSGNSEDRRRRRAWLVETYRADRDMFRYLWPDGKVEYYPARPGTIDTPTNNNVELPTVVRVPACWCYRCPKLLTAETLTVDRIIPGALGGTYRRNNIRPACSDCNNQTGGKLGASRAKR